MRNPVMVTHDIICISIKVNVVKKVMFNSQPNNIHTIKKKKKIL